MALFTLLKPAVQLQSVKISYELIGKSKNKGRAWKEVGGSATGGAATVEALLRRSG